jgi:hypothetical protein
MVTELQLQKLRDKKRLELEKWAIERAHNEAKRVAMKSSQSNPWSYYRNNISDFTQTFFPTRKIEDFPNFFDPAGDITNSGGSLSDDQPGFSQFKWLYEKRLGVCNNIVTKPAEDAVKNKFRLAKFNGEIDETLTDNVMEWLEDPEVKFWDQLTLALTYERAYGIGIIIKYYQDAIDDREKLAEPAPKNELPVTLQAFPPDVMTPLNTERTVYLDSDPRTWDWHGGRIGPAKIDHSRVQVIMTRPSTTRWFGQSLFEAIWIPLLLYFEVFVYMLRHFTKWGNIIPKYMVDAEDDLDTIYTSYADLIEEMKMNGSFVGRKGDELDFAPTGTAEGLTELMEILKEEIAARTRIPVIVTFGRTSNAGLGSAGYLLAQMEYWGEVANIQRSISDDVMRMIKAAGFDIKKRRLDWMLSINKTDQQRLIDEGMQIENEIMKERLMQARLQTMMLADQAQNPEKYMDQGDNKGDNEKKVKPSEKDFVNPIYEKIKAERQARIEAYMKDMNLEVLPQ